MLFPLFNVLNVEAGELRGRKLLRAPVSIKPEDILHAKVYFEVGGTLVIGVNAKQGNFVSRLLNKDFPDVLRYIGEKTPFELHKSLTFKIGLRLLGFQMSYGQKKEILRVIDSLREREMLPDRS